jgi:hypothetical protein
MAITKRYNPEVPLQSFQSANSTVPIFDTVKRLEVPLTAAQLIAMSANAVSILAAPGANKVHVVDTILFEMNRTANAFTGGNTVQFTYTTANTIQVTAGVVPANVLTAANAGTTVTVLTGSTGANSLLLAANDGISVTSANAFAAGTGTAIVHLVYRTFAL